MVKSPKIDIDKREDCDKVDNSSKEVQTPKKELPPKPKQEKPKKVVEVNEYDPKWNVEGSWEKAEIRSELIRHLSGPNHQYQTDYLMSLSTDDLQRLHDADHNSRGTRVRTRTFRFFRR